jgi:hypothetical protein
LPAASEIFGAIMPHGVMGGKAKRKQIPPCFPLSGMIP